MTSFKGIDVQSEQAKLLQTSLQTELAVRGYSTDDDSVMAEYIVVMLANQKTLEQINGELLDLIGTDYDASLTTWLWNEAERIFHGREQPVEEATAGPSVPSPSRDMDRSLRRSRSPVSRQERRRSRSPPPAYVAHDTDRTDRQYDTQEPEPAFNGRAFWQKRAEEKRQRSAPSRAPRELFSYTVSQATGVHVPERGAADTRRQNIDPPRTQPATMAAERPVVNIFGRAGLPDPRAAEFVPDSLTLAPHQSSDSTASQTGEGAVQQGGSIFSRIDPMLPNNAPLSPAASAPTPATGEFPSAPSETEICRWNLKCTNPMCPYSHASPANAGPNGDENALTLSQEPCKFSAGCTNKSCVRSHVSPSIAFLDRKVASAVTNTFGSKLVHSSEACKFQATCTNPSCAYKHYDASGNVVPCPALVALSNGSAMQQSSQPAVDMQMPDDTDDTTITTTAHADTSGAATDTTALLDKALSNAPSSRTCKFGASCTRPDCYFAHPSERKVAATGGGQTPCRFGLGCTRPGCYYSHPPGHKVLSARPTSDRLGVFSNESTDDQEMERILPDAQPTNATTSAVAVTAE